MLTFFAGLATGLVIFEVTDFLLQKWIPEGYEDEKGFHYGKPDQEATEDEIEMFRRLV